MRPFLVSLFITSAILVSSVYFLHDQGFFSTIPGFLWQTLILLNITTASIFAYLIRSARGIFVQLYLLSMVLKLLAYAGYNILIILLDRENAGGNVGFFMITYLLFTTLELIFLYRKINY